MNQREYNNRRTMEDLRERNDVLEQQLLQMEGLYELIGRMDADFRSVMATVTETVIEANDVGGVDLNDLADRLRAKGYPLDGDEE